MKPLELAAYSYWQHARRGRRAIAAGEVAAAADAVAMVAQIGCYAKAESLARCCRSTMASLRVLAVRHFGRVSYFTSEREVARIVALASTAAERTPPSTPRPPSSPLGAA